MAFNVYNDHKGTHVSFPWVQTIEEVRELAAEFATLGTDAFFRVFRQVHKAESVTGELFETAFSVLNGTVREHKDVTIPMAHW